MGQLGSIPLAYRGISGQGAGIMFLGGFHSDMMGQKAQYLAEWSARRGCSFIRFDYLGHGISGGRFEQGTIGQWLEDAALVLNSLTAGPQILVGSSMGGWIALLLALRFPERTRALVGIAAAPDFTEDLIWADLPQPIRDQIMDKGIWHQQSAYGGSYPITRDLILEGRRHLLLRGNIPLSMPVRLLHGQADADVPWQRSLALSECLASADVEVTLIKNADHRLSNPADLALLGGILGGLIGEHPA